MSFILKTTFLFTLTAVAEIAGCYWHGKSPRLLLPAALCLALFVWLLSLHPSAAGRTYAAYGGAYVAMALVWLWIVEGIRPDRWNVIGASISLIGMEIIAFAPRNQ